MKILSIMIILSILGAFLSRWRGGYDFFGIDLPHGVKRAILAVVPTVAMCLPFSDFLNIYFWLFSYLLFLVVGIVQGWGSWYQIGRNPDSYKHNADAFWVEYISYWVYGAKWIPKVNDLSITEYVELESRFNIIDSPTGDLRPEEWRIRMEKFAMSIRGLGMTLPQGLALFVFMAVYHDIINYYILTICPLGFLLGWCYSVGFEIKTNRLPKWLKLTTNIGEFLSGAIIMGGPLYILSTFSLL